MGNVKFKVWDNPPDGEIAKYVRSSALQASWTLSDIDAGKHILQNAFGDWPDVMQKELLQLREKFKSRL
ncbi:hypothetical protein CLV99_1045 [Sphingobacterium yanglingense]|uniref:Uncharacterized protein n=1 Tax=Sphingobacterium yanglingense TaxID=1437280 RepID=A0A4R6WHC1_9SPHI|nr:hypothetical protein CLV99_1045 [Sphingobacterium yanglingense]